MPGRMLCAHPRKACETEPPVISGPTFRTHAISALALAAAYFVAAAMGLQWAMVSGAGSPVWPAGGVALAGVLIGGQRLWPVIVVARLLAGLSTGSGQPLWAEAVLALGAGIAALVAMRFLERFPTFDRRLMRVSDVGLFAAAGGVQALVSASIGSLVLVVSSSLNSADTLALVSRWINAQVVGTLTIGPAILCLWGADLRNLEPRSKIHFALLLVCAVAVSGFVLLDYQMFYLRQWHLFPLLAWAAVAFQMLGAALVMLIVSGFAIAGASIGVGPFTDLPAAAGEPIWLAQQFVALSSFVVLLLAAALDERRHNEILALALKAGRLGLWEFEMQNGKALYDRQYAEMLGYKLAELPQVMATWKRLIHPDDKSRVMRALQEHLDRTSSDYCCEYRLQHKNGTWRWILSRGEVVTRDAMGRPVRVVGISSDITDQKQAEQHTAFLYQEVQHRAKNMLAVVVAVVRQTAPEGFADDLTSRLQGLAASQDLIVTGKWMRIELHELVKKQLSALVPHPEQSVTMVGPMLTISPAAAQAIGMALHELATNAVKYGALSVPGGHVQIIWSVEGTTFRMGWQENGGPKVVEPKRKGFGHIVTTRMVEFALSGKVELTFSPEGVTWRLVSDVQKVVSLSPCNEKVYSST